METITIIADIANLVLALGAVVITCKLVLRTEKCFDRAAKAFLGSSLILLAASLLEMNKYLDVVNQDMAVIIFNVSRALSLVFFVYGVYTLFEIANQKCDWKK